MPTAAIASFRKVTPGVIASARLAMANDVPRVTKGEVAIALKRAARPLGIDGTAYHVLDILLGLSKARDWEAGNRPVVAISNRKLAEYVGRSERTVIRALKRLVEAGILAYRDSSTGRRWVHRNTEGAIERAYGLDFRPAQVRYGEITALADAYQAELNAEREARRAVVRLSRAILDIVESAAREGLALDLSPYMRRLETVMSATRPAQDKAADLDELYEALVSAVAEGGQTADRASDLAGDRQERAAGDDLSRSPDMTGAGDIGVTPLSITNAHPLRNPCNNERTPASAGDINTKPDGGYAAEWLPKREQAGKAERTGKTHGTQPKGGGHRSKGSEDRSPNPHLCDVSIHLIETACRLVGSELGLSLSSWNDLRNAVEALRLAVGVSQSAWAVAEERLGGQTAAAILIVVVEKSLREPDRIGSPGGYFRAMVERAGEGRLNLARSLFGLAAE